MIISQSDSLSTGCAKTYVDKTAISQLQSLGGFNDTLYFTSSRISTIFGFPVLDFS